MNTSFSVAVINDQIIVQIIWWDSKGEILLVFVEFFLFL